jgi:uncharacterized membrane protein
MTPALRAAVGAFFIFTAYFVAGSLISDSMRFPYGYVSAGGLVLFLATGFYIARHYSTVAAGVATGLAALFASLAAWGIMAMLNPSNAVEPRPQAQAIGEVVVLMTIAALVAGFIGAWVGGRSGTKRSAD